MRLIRQNALLISPQEELHTYLFVSACCALAGLFGLDTSEKHRG